MLIKKQFITIYLILSLSLLNILSNNRVDKNVFYPRPGNDKFVTHQDKYEANELQMESGINTVETPGTAKKYYIEIPEQHIRIKYFDFCGSPGMEECSLRLVINSSIESEFTLSDEISEVSEVTLTEGKLKIGQNDVDIPYSKNFLRKPSHEYTFKYSTCGESKEVKIAFNLKYDGWPENKIFFEPKTGAISLNLKSEGKKVIKKKTKLVLDKKVMIKSGLPGIFLGALILFVSPQINKFGERAKVQSIRTSIESSKRLVTTFGIGFTVYGLSSIFRALKKSKFEGEVLKSDGEAIIYNRNLKKEYEIKELEWKDRIVVTVLVAPVPNNSNKEVK